MARRIVRTLCQIAACTSLFCVLVFFADSRYRVLPDSIHQALPSHHAGTVITDVTIAFCSSVNPLSKCRLEDDNWKRVEKDLILGAGWVRSAYLHVRRKQEEELLSDDQVVVGVRVGPRAPAIGEKDEGQEPWESRPGGIWIQRSRKRHDSDSDRAVTAIDVLFGHDAVDPRPNWILESSSLSIDGVNLHHAPRLSVRYGRPRVEHENAPIPRVNKDGKFKIVQISDAHLSTGTGACRDAIGADNKPSVHCEADPRTLEFIEQVLDDEKPDLVILSGDQVEGPTAPDTQTALFKMVAPLIERSIPYAAIFGNHDDEGQRSSPRVAQMALLQTLPYSLSEPGPTKAEGVGNYYVEVLAPGSQHSALTLYMLDTHGLTPDEKRYKGYDWIKPGQIDWFRETAKGLKKAHSKYSHIHMDMAFMHIPLPEYGDRANVMAGGAWKEGVTAPGYNSNFYDALADAGIVAVGCGHDHVNDYCALRPHKHLVSRDEVQEQHSSSHRERLGPWLCYAGGSGFGGYGGYGGFHRRLRVWEMDTNAGRMSTWKRVECCGEETKKKIDETVLVDGGNVIAPV